MINSMVGPQDYVSYDSQIRLGTLTGFRSNRRFTDLFCCLSYLLLVGACIGLVLYNRTASIPDFEKPRDSDHQPCRSPHNVLYFPSQSLNKSVCVAECPQSAGQILNCRTNSKLKECPISVSGLIANRQLNICHLPSLKIPLSTINQAINNSVFKAQRQIMVTLGIMAVIGFVLVITSLLFPQMVYLYTVLFQSVIVFLAAAFFLKFFTGRLPFIQSPSNTNGRGSVFQLAVAILLSVSAVISITMMATRFPLLRFTIKIIRLARLALFENPLILVWSMVLTFLSIGAFVLNMWLYSNIESFGALEKTSSGMDQYRTGVLVYLMRIMFYFQVLWTHGFLISLSHFIFETKGTLWYYNQVLGDSWIFNFTTTLKLVFWHLGTICFGSVNVYHSQAITNAVNNSQYYSSPADFETCCVAHNSCFRYLSIYGFLPTILEGLPFLLANQRVSELKIVTQTSYPELYMQGSYFTNSGKFFLTVVSMIVVYTQLVITNPDIYFSTFSLTIPLLITAFVAYQIGTAWLDSTGTLGDTILLNHSVEAKLNKQFSPGYLLGHPEVLYVVNEKVKMPTMNVF